MKSPLPFAISILLFCTACGSKTKKEEKEQSFFPVLSFIQSQVAHVDTSLYQIEVYDIKDSTHADTSYIKREEFKAMARDFLTLPDLQEEEYKKRFREEKIFDGTIGRAIVIYQAVEPEKELIRRQEVVLKPGVETEYGTISSIIIDYVSDSKDSLIKKRMLWQADKSFLVTTTKQLPGQEETTTTRKVAWNENK